MKHLAPRPKKSNRLSRSVSLVQRVCELTNQSSWVDALKYEMSFLGLVAAVEKHDTATIFDWMMRELSYQGISDIVAEGYMSRYGSVTWHEIEIALKAGASCDKLETHWSFHKCGYQKGTHSCSAMDQIDLCPLPRHTLRNGRLNQTAYSLFLFIRDIAESDIVGWIDQQLLITDPQAAQVRANFKDELRA